MSYCEWPEFYNESTPKARKTYKCVECRAPIDIGEEHLYYRGKWDGEFDHGRQHFLCMDLCVALRHNNPFGDECIPFGNLFEEWPEFQAARRSEKARWDDKDLSQRHMMAKIKWRGRKHWVHKKRINGVLMKRKWGMPWEIVEERKHNESNTHV